jgi:hemolysin III
MRYSSENKKEKRDKMAVTTLEQKNLAIEKLNRKLAKQQQKVCKTESRLVAVQSMAVPCEAEVKTELQTEKQQRKLERKATIRAKNTPPALPLLEEIGNSITHGLGAVFALVALALMLTKSDTPLKIAAAIIYGTSLFLMMLFSCLYHAFPKGSTVKRVFRRFDYSSIYLLIGGTFAPLLLVYSGTTLSFALFGVQWAAIITGITMVAVFGPGRLRWLHYPLYFIIGWSGLLFLPDWIAHAQNLLWFILGGGIVYTVGMIPFVFRGKKAAHFIWHFFVLGGAIIQFVGIYLYVF